MAENQPVATFITQSDEFLCGRDTFYKPLNPDRREIRLAHIRPGQYDDTIHLTLTTVDLDSRPLYETISYTWGPMAITRQVVVHGLPYHVTMNQYAALRRLRLPDKRRVLWMDVVCIDQANLHERSRQVSIMDDVYARAACTIVWLGDFDKELHTPMSDEAWVKHVASLEDMRNSAETMFRVTTSDLRDELTIKFLQIDGLVEQVEFILRQLGADVHLEALPFCSLASNGELVYNRQWFDAVNVLYNIMLSPWWKRIWVLQEVLLCRQDPLVFFGPFVLPFRIFLRAGECFGKHSIIDRCCFGATLPAFGSTAVCDRLFLLQDTSLLETSYKDHPMTLDGVIACTREKEASDIRDQVYGVLGLVEPTDRVTVDYTGTVGQIFASTSWHVMKSNGDFTLLARGGLDSARTSDIPTWSTDWITVDEKGFEYNKIFGMDEKPDWNLTKFENGELELVAAPLTRVRSVLIKAQVKDEEPTDCRDSYDRIWTWLRELEGSGHKVDTTKWTTATYRDDNFFFDLFRTIFRDTIANGSMDDEAGRLSEKDWEAIVEWWTTMNKCVREGTERLFETSEVQTSFLLHTNDTTLALTEESKLCLVPASSQADDVLYHIRACCPPIVLRKTSDGAFNVVGAAYLHGMMDLDGGRKADEGVVTLR